MARTPTPPLAATVSFIDAINRTDLDALGALMHDEHRLEIGGTEPVVGREANVAAWRGYVEAFPDYVIHPRYLTSNGGRVAVLGTTTGSHLGLPDDEEAKLGVVWLADVADGLLMRWVVLDDDGPTRAEAAIPAEIAI
ncbi:MAG: nuclear transport factor 2 family protein [Actinomycetota bacterium]|nr:nuclear transport factor 2 family protein [Actinomycetota bacterium]